MVGLFPLPFLATGLTANYTFSGFFHCLSSPLLDNELHVLSDIELYALVLVALPSVPLSIIFVSTLED